MTKLSLKVKWALRMKSWSQTEMDSLLDGITEPATIISLDYRILAANRAYRQTYSQRSDLINQTCYGVSHGFTQPCDLAGEACPIKLCQESGQRQRILHQHQTPEGEEHVDVEVSPIHDAKGKLVAYLEILHLVKEARPRATGSQGLIGRSTAFNQMLSLMRRAAPSDITLLLLGETGTGKELVARAIHDSSSRRAKPFITVECSGLPETLFESELFGHERGAFTGATGRKRGLVEAAHGGTLFLDEIGEIPLPLQVKLLRLIETGTYRSVGGVEPQHANFRLICATHRHLKQQVEAGEFRADLYYRIAAFPIELPSLRARKEDLPLLVESLLKRIPGAEQVKVTREAIQCLQAYPFPGNIRELRNILERGALLADEGVIDVQHLPAECVYPQSVIQEADHLPQRLIQGEVLNLDELERAYLNYLVDTHQSLEKASLAELLGVSERTLYRKLKQVAEKQPHH